MISAAFGSEPAPTVMMGVEPSHVTLATVVVPLYGVQ